MPSINVYRNGANNGNFWTLLDKVIYAEVPLKDDYVIIKDKSYKVDVRCFSDNNRVEIYVTENIFGTPQK
jgi:hypothetical protein